MTGGTGNDIYYVNGAADVIVEMANGGFDQVYSTANYTLAAGVSVEGLFASGSASLRLFGNELDNGVYGGAGNDSLTGGAGNDTVIGGAGNDTIDGGLGDDTMAGGVGNDMLYGGSGNDTLDGGAGADTMTGGAGDDIYTVNGAADIIVETANGGIDQVYTTANYTLAAGVSVEEVFVTGSAGRAISGNELNNRLSGGAGNDTLSGGAGDDVFFGGSGVDSFVFNTQGDVDKVMDFSNDRLRFDASAFAGMEALGLGALNAAEFSTAGATQTNGQFIYDSTNGALYFDADGTGDQASYLVALIDNNASLQSGWITLF
jgi:Ca2+-binding RTX toxin-like protein